MFEEKPKYSFMADIIGSPFLQYSIYNFLPEGTVYVVPDGIDVVDRFYIKHVVIYSLLENNSIQKYKSGFVCDVPKDSPLFNIIALLLLEE